MRRVFAGVGVFIAAAGTLYLGSHLGPTTAPAVTTTVTQATTSSVAVSTPTTTTPTPPPQTAVQSRSEGELQSEPHAGSDSVDPHAGNPSSSALASEDEPARKRSETSEEGPQREPETANPKGQLGGDEASPAALPYTTQKYLHDPFTETPASRSRALASTSSVPAASDAASDVTSAVTSDPNDYTTCAPSDGSPAPDDAGKANIRRANEWATAASSKAASLGLGTGRYDWLRCRGDVIAEWLAAGGPEPLGHLGRRGFDSTLATCAYQIVVNRSATVGQYALVASLNGSEYFATVASCDATNADVCAYTFTARCELQRQPVTAKWTGPSTTECLHGDTKTASDGPCE